MPNERNFDLEKKNLKYLREVKNLTQKFLASCLNCTRDAVAKWESNDSKRHIPADYLDNICQLFEVEKTNFCTLDLEQSSKKTKDNSDSTPLSRMLCEYADIMWSDQDFEEAVDAYVHAIALGSIRAIKSLSLQLNSLPTAFDIDFDGDGPYERVYHLTNESFEKYSNSSIIRAINTVTYYPILYNEHPTL